MNNWLSFLQTQGAVIKNGDITSFGDTKNEGALLVCPLSDRGMILLTGPDTNKLLQGQVTCDINQLERGKGLSGTLCTVKGRVVSHFVLFRLAEDSVILLTHKGLLGITLETLKKYAVFYKTALSDASSDYIALGLISANRPPVLQDSLVHPLNDNQAIVLSPAPLAESLWLSLLNEGQPAGLPCWQLECIRNGLGDINPQTTDEFIPQMLNFQHTGAISFRKGCYTGQEIVARMQYLGKLKRRMYHLSAALGTVPEAGCEIFLPGKEQNCGHIVMAQPATADTTEILAVLTREAAQSDELVIGGAASTFQVIPLPYENKLTEAEEKS